MNIAQIKTQIGQPILNMARQLDEQEVPQPWVSHWDNDNRVRVTMHDDVFNTILADKLFDKLAYKKEVVLANEKRAEYTRYVVITPKQLLATF